LTNDREDIRHKPVLADKLAEQINLPSDAVMVDATIGHGGHSLLFGKSLGSDGLIVGFDVDPDCLERARRTLQELRCRLILIKANFAHITRKLRENNINNADFILADLGICSGQIEDRRLGLSFQKNMPLDMRMDKELELTASDIVNTSDQQYLADLIYNYGQDRASRRIARFIVLQRKKQPIRTTAQLAGIVCKALGKPAVGHKERIHPATRTFQALRIAVNHELENLEKLLTQAPKLLSSAGKIAVISFHSLEDRIVKLDFKQNRQNDIYKILTKKPITPSPAEVQENPRARSAKLRIGQKL